MRPLPRPVAQALPFLTVFLVAAVVGAELARPLRSASVAFDSQVAVLDFQRLLAGRHVESFLSTTPKPLLTAVFGSLYAVSHDWRPLAWATILAYALGVVLAGILARRIGGPLAGAFSAVAVLSSPALLFDVGFSLATPWAMLGWLAAGLALTAPRPRYAIAGIALALAALARVETLVIVGVALLAVGWATFAPVGWRFGSVPRRAWLVPLLGFLALPVMLLHDALLFGDPLFWSTVAVRYSAATHLHILTPVELVRFLGDRYWTIGALTLLAIVGLARALRDRQTSLVVGLLAMGPGIAVFLLFLAFRHVFVSDRYTAAIDVAVAFAAGLGFAGLSVDIVRWAPLRAMLARAGGASLVTVGVTGAALAAAILAGPYWRVDPALRGEVETSLRLAIDADRARPVLAAALDAIPGSRGPIPAGATAQPPMLFVPTPIRPRMAVDLGLDLPRIGTLDPTKIDLAAGYPAVGEIVLHDRAGDAASSGWASLEVSTPQTGGKTLVIPLLADPERGLWVLKIE